MTEIRRYLRAGMGLCQGQTCSRLVKGIVAKELGVSPAEIEPIEMHVFANEGEGGRSV